MTEKEKLQQRRSAEDALFNRMLLWLLGVIIAEAVILFVKRFYVNITTSDFDIAAASVIGKFFSVYVWVGLVLTVLGILWCVLFARKGKALRLPFICTVVVAFFWIMTLLTYFLFDVGMKILVALPIAAAILIIIYFLYPRAFFINAILAGCGMALLWCFRQGYSAHPTVLTIGFVVAWLALIAVAVLAGVLKKNGGKLGKLKLVNDAKSYPVCWVNCAVLLVIAVLGFVLGTSFAYYLIYVLIGWLFCLAVYFTVKLM